MVFPHRRAAFWAAIVLLTTFSTSTFALNEPRSFVSIEEDNRLDKVPALDLVKAASEQTTGSSSLDLANRHTASLLEQQRHLQFEDIIEQVATALLSAVLTALAGVITSIIVNALVGTVDGPLEGALEEVVETIDLLIASLIVSFVVAIIFGTGDEEDESARSFLADPFSSRRRLSELDEIGAMVHRDELAVLPLDTLLKLGPLVVTSIVTASAVSGMATAPPLQKSVGIVGTESLNDLIGNSHGSSSYSSSASSQWNQTAVSTYLATVGMTTATAATAKSGGGGGAGGLGQWGRNFLGKLFPRLRRKRNQQGPLARMATKLDRIVVSSVATGLFVQAVASNSSTAPADIASQVRPKLGSFLAAIPGLDGGINTLRNLGLKSLIPNKKAADPLVGNVDVIALVSDLLKNMPNVDPANLDVSSILAAIGKVL